MSSEDNLQPLLKLREWDLENAAARFRASVVVDVALFRLLIGAGLCTVDAACEMIQGVFDCEPELFGHPLTAHCIGWAVDMLRGMTPLHGSLIDQVMQKSAREARNDGSD